VNIWRCDWLVRVVDRVSFEVQIWRCDWLVRVVDRASFEVQIWRCDWLVRVMDRASFEVQIWRCDDNASVALLGRREVVFAFVLAENFGDGGGGSELAHARMSERVPVKLDLLRRPL